jgi:hypothetical protein
MAKAAFNKKKSMFTIKLELTIAPRYVANHVLHRDLDVAKVRDIFQTRTTTHRSTLAGHPIPLMRPLLAPPPPRRLKRTWTFDARS